LRRQARPVPPESRERGRANRMTCDERARVLTVLTSDEFVGSTPVQVFASPLDRGTYLSSVSTMYRTLAVDTMVKEQRRRARHASFQERKAQPASSTCAS